MFTMFMVAYALDAFFFFLRGFYALESVGDIIFWKLTNVMYPIMTAPLAVFLAYPYLKEKAGTATAWGIRLVMLYSLVVLVFNITLVAISDVSWTYNDLYGMSHFSLESFIPHTYYLTLGLVISVALISVVFLAIAARRETDSFYKNRALLLMFGWLIVVLGQMLLLSPVLAILNPFVIITGMLLLVVGVLRTKK